ncbi:MAG TPA: hypothetical protein VMZ53_07265 [Kofleriaceae bacterium]|nr:hypothetical protein [Kofleriaceae bacterium]
MRVWTLVLLVACGKDAGPAKKPEAARKDAGAAAAVAADAAGPSVEADSFADLGIALETIIPPDARVVGFGELHNRTDRAQVKSSLAHFTQEGLPAISDKMSDLIVETWVVDPKCGQQAKTATAKVEITVRRPQETKSEIALLAEAARAAKIQPHAMKIKCDEYDKIAPQGKEVAPDVLLDLTTRELGRISEEAVKHRDKEPEHRPWIALYGGALHNDRFPAKGVESWSYAAKVDGLTANHYVEVDLIVPELAELDPGSQSAPWFPLVQSKDDKVKVFKRGERSYVIVLPRTPG